MARNVWRSPRNTCRQAALVFAVLGLVMPSWSSAAPSKATDIPVGAGKGVTLVFNPGPSYRVADVVVDGVSVGPVARYTISPVTADHAVDAQFIKFNVLKLSSSGNGAIKKVISGTTAPKATAAKVQAPAIPTTEEVAVDDQKDVALQFEPNDGYEVHDVLVDGQSVGPVATYTIQKMQRNTTVEASFSPVAEWLTPVASRPVSGGTITSLTPSLSVFNPLVPETLTYEFQVATDSEFTNLVAVEGSIAQSPTETSWTVPTPLADKMRYYWRARATDGTVSSPWTAVCTFMVDTDGVETTSTIDLSEYLVADAPSVFEVTGVQSPTQGVVVDIPANALGADTLLTVGTVENAPAATQGVRALGKVYELGPHGVPFAEPVTLMLPYSQDDLVRTGAPDASQLSVVTFNTDTLAWEQVPVAAVDYKGRRLVCKVGHFSMYAIGVADTSDNGGGTPPPAGGDQGGGGGGGGGCFIATMGDASQSPGALLPTPTILISLLVLGAILGVPRKETKDGKTDGRSR
ncbi:MAG: hypothetical protein HZB55_14345 [Deltaproteobacteria bacterium]|nr:hypothetical protein [Deltaproteobacteria bacterium]